MKRISQQQLLKAIFNNVLGEDFHPNSLNDRVVLQKIVFLMREKGISCGDYKFVWDLYGPFSPSLSDDMKKGIIDDGDKPVVFNRYAEKIMKKINQIIYRDTTYSVRYWIESIASLLYLKEYMYPSYTDEELITTLEHIKPTLNQHHENEKAMSALKEIISI